MFLEWAMRQLGWLTLQCSAVAVGMWLAAEVATKEGTPVHWGQAFLFGMMLAFILTIVCNIVAGQYRYWTKGS